MEHVLLTFSDSQKMQINVPVDFQKKTEFRHDVFSTYQASLKKQELFFHGESQQAVCWSYKPHMMC